MLKRIKVWQIIILAFILISILLCQCNNSESLKENIIKNINLDSNNQQKDVNEDFVGTIIVPSKDIKGNIYLGEENIDKYKLVMDSRFSYPGNGKKNIILAGHRDTIAKEISKLEIDDIIQIEVNNKRFNYRVNDIVIVDQEDITPLKEKDEEKLIIYTCYPFSKFSSYSQRYVVIADLI